MISICSSYPSGNKIRSSAKNKWEGGDHSWKVGSVSIASAVKGTFLIGIYFTNFVYVNYSVLSCSLIS